MMKDILITVNRQKFELKLYLFCFVFAFCVNIFSIIYYKTEFSELYTQLFMVFTLSVFFYVLSVLFRLLFVALFKRKKR